MHFCIRDDILAHVIKRIKGFKDFRGGFQKMAKANFDQWEGFGGHLWKEEVNVRDFIQHNYTQYDGDESFLADPTEATNKLWGEPLQTRRRRSVPKAVSSIWRQRLFPD